jgi:hypothetical protein
MRKLILTMTAVSFLAAGCSTFHGAVVGITSGVSGVENKKGNVIEFAPTNEITPKYLSGYLSGLHVALTVGLFVVNPIIGGAYLGANAIYGAGRLTNTTPNVNAK